MLSQEPGRQRTLITNQTAAGPARAVQHSLQPARVLGVDRSHSSHDLSVEVSRSHRGPGFLITIHPQDQLRRKHCIPHHTTVQQDHAASYPVRGIADVRLVDDGTGGARLGGGSGGAGSAGGTGLTGLTQRVRTVDGRLDIDSPRGGPTTVTVDLPVHT
jgi:hypothetical protein